MVDALAAAGDRARGVATVRAGVSRAELADLHAAGVRGIRFNFVKRLVNPKPDDYYLRLAEAVAELGWHIVVYFEAPDLAERWPLFTSLPTVVVVNHMGRPDVSQPVDGPDFARFTRFMRENENVWSKVSGAERLSISGPPEYADVVPFARHIVEAFPDRVIWGTDWPHPNMKSHMPDDGNLVERRPAHRPHRGPAAPAAGQQPHALVLGVPLTTYTSEFDDIPGTRVFTAQRAKQGYQLNQFCMSLMKAENRERFKADERAYLDEWPMTEAQKQAVLDRDYNAMLDLGGNIYFLAKIFATDGLSYVQAVSTMTGMSVPDYQQMMLNGGRPPEGWRSVKEGN